MENFFKANRTYAVAGASANPAKFGNKVVNWYKTHSIPVVPINPKSEVIQGIQSVPSIDKVPVPSNNDLASSVVTPPAITKQSIENLSQAQGTVNASWSQPGTHDPEIVKLAKEKVADVITDCILVNGERALQKSRL